MPDEPSTQSDTLAHLVQRCVTAIESGRSGAVSRICAENEEFADRILERLAGLCGPERVTSGDARRVPDSIGPYRVVAEIAEGGMGLVYEAEQREPVRRRVAIKVIKTGMNSSEVVARFDLERRALAAMNHTNIARVLDAGSTVTGQPYFVMELIKGLPITTYCDKHRLSLPERVDLIRQVCGGVHHAHQKGVMHRDLKPANILVVREGDQAVPKIVDFGLAKATDREFFAQTIYTKHELIVGTPEYMAPEQAAGDAKGIDVRVDVYSLGVTLYELLVGALPYSWSELRRLGWAQMQKTLTETEPPKPSERIEAAEHGTDRARKRRTHRRGLIRELRGDLDWIVLRAMDKDPEHRYGTASDLAQDLLRHLRDEPVLAGPPSVKYRLEKLLRRFRVQFAAAAVVVLALLIGAAAMTVFAVQSHARATASRERTQEFDLLKNVVHLNEARAAQAGLYPAWPERIPDFESWLADYGEPLRLALPRLRRTVTALQHRAKPRTAADADADRSSHPRFPELQLLTAKVGAQRLAQRARVTGESVPIPELPAPLRDSPPDELEVIARSRGGPENGGRGIYGEEALAVACARAALVGVEAGRGTVPRQTVLDTLAWSLFAVGRDAEAIAHSEAALEAAPQRQKHDWSEDLRDLKQAVAAAGETLRTNEESLQRVRADVESLRTWRFHDDSDEFLHNTLADLITQLVTFQTDQRRDVENGLFWARRIGELTLDHPKARVTWADVSTALGRADGHVASELYREHPIELRPQTGLVPIGKNPVTGLFEFYHLRSAWDPSSGVVPAEIEIPTHRDDGSIEVTDETGIIFVLLPGQTFVMGTQSRNPEDPNFDARALPDDTTRTVRIETYFIARHELTQGQWLRLAGGGNPSHYPVGWVVPKIAPIASTHPVESVSWQSSHDLMHSLGLALPTEAQWEYACRGGKSTPWWAGTEPSSMHGVANTKDQRAQNRTPWTGKFESWDDGFASHSPVGTYRANDFGVFDAHGNVREWCADEGSQEDYRVNRGGSFSELAKWSRSAMHSQLPATTVASSVGLRAARARLRN